MICELLWFHLLQQTLAQLLLNRGEGGETCLSPLNFPVTPVLIMFAFAGRVRTVHHAQTLQGWAEMRPVVLIHQLFFFFAVSIQYPCAFLLNGGSLDLDP